MNSAKAKDRIGDENDTSKSLRREQAERHIDEIFWARISVSCRLAMTASRRFRNLIEESARRSAADNGITWGVPLAIPNLTARKAHVNGIPRPRID
jgi:hypothetical protein